MAKEGFIGMEGAVQEVLRTRINYRQLDSAPPASARRRSIYRKR